MSKCTCVPAACLAVFGLAQASPAHEIILDIPDLHLAGGEEFTYAVEVEDDDDDLVTTMYFEGLFENLGEDGSWASDLQLTVTAPNGQTLVVGGFDHLADADQWWDFQGSPSEPSAPYASLITEDFDVAPVPGGLWEFTFLNDRAGTELHTWTEVQIWLIPEVVPAPGVLCLLLLAAAGPRSRRRRVDSGDQGRWAMRRGS